MGRTTRRHARRSSARRIYELAGGCVALVAIAGCGGGTVGPKSTPGILVTAPADPRTTEKGGQTSFTVTLASQPSSVVTIPVASTNYGEGAVAIRMLTFTPDDWDVPQTVTVTGVDDHVADGDQGYRIAFGPSASSDPAFESLSALSVELTNLDDDSAGVVLGPPSGDTREDGTQASFTVVLTSEPMSDVTLTFLSDDTTEGTIAPSMLTFTPEDWNAPKTITVTGVDDSIADGNVAYTVSLATIATDDVRYAALALVPPVTLHNLDDDSAGVTLSAISGDTNEAAGKATFTVRLNSQPLADVTVSFASNDTTEGTTDVSSLLFTPLDWNVPRTVTVTGVLDFLVDGTQAYAIVFSPTTSADAAYAGLTPQGVAVQNLDAAVIDFDDVTAPCAFASQVALTTEYAAQGATFAGGGELLDQCSGFSVGGQSPPNFLAFSTSVPASPPETVTFASPLSAVSFEVAGDTAGTATLVAYDAADTLLGSSTLDITSIAQTLAVAYPGIARVVVLSTASAFVLDDLAMVP